MGCKRSVLCPKKEVHYHPRWYTVYCYGDYDIGMLLWCNICLITVDGSNIECRGSFRYNDHSLRQIDTNYKPTTGLETEFDENDNIFVFHHKHQCNWKYFFTIFITVRWLFNVLAPECGPRGRTPKISTRWQHFWDVSGPTFKYGLAQNKDRPPADQSIP